MDDVLSQLLWGQPGLYDSDSDTPQQFDFSGPAGSQPSGWEGTWLLDGSGHLVPQVSEGATNYFTNGDMETGDPPTDWSAGTGAAIAADPTAHGGSQAIRVIRAGSDYPTAGQVPNLPQARFWLARSWNRIIDCNSCYITWGNTWSDFNNTTTYQLIETVCWYPGADYRPRLAVAASGMADGVSGLHDDAEVREVTGVYELLGTGSAYGRASVKITRDTLSKALGLVLNYTDPNNTAFVLFDGYSKIHYLKHAGGLTTVIGSWSITYAVGATLDVTRHQNGTVDITYDGVSVVSGVAASGLAGTKLGLLGTENTQQFDDFEFTTVGVS
jgi:hypothetical protein